MQFNTPLAISQVQTFSLLIQRLLRLMIMGLAYAGVPVLGMANPHDPVLTSSTTPLAAAMQAYSWDVAQEKGWNPEWVRSILVHAKPEPKAKILIMPATASPTRNWHQYRDRMVEKKRIQAGVLFWRTHLEWLKRAQQEFGVPPEIIIGILGVETIFGRHTGNFRVLDTLSTLAFDFPTGRSDRSPFFRRELTALLELAHTQKIDILQLRGSFAGAIGIPQFMPSSIIEYATDFDQNGQIDLLHSPADVIGSVAQYLAKFGWQSNWPTHFDVTPPSDLTALNTLLEPDIVAQFTPQQFMQYGAKLPELALEHPGKLALVKLDNGSAPPTYIAGTDNFYTITRYNQSSYYALSVISLGRAIKSAYQQTPQAPAKP